MSRYIDADKLILHLNDYKLQVSPNWKDEWERMVSCLVIDTCMDAVKEQPTANVVEVVRCKDCKHSSPNKVYGCRFEPFNTLENGERMYSDDFCSYGERADE